MSRIPLPLVGAPSKVSGFAGFLAAVLSLFCLLSIWIVPWLTNKFHRASGFTPEPLSGAWFLAFTAVGILCVLLIVAEILVVRDRNVSARKKWGTAGASLCALLLCVLWTAVTATQSSPRSLLMGGKKHTVTLRWEKSTSAVAGYNIYRRAAPNGSFAKINTDLVKGLSFVDRDVKEGTYYYVARAVDSTGRESNDSNVAVADVP